MIKRIWVYCLILFTISLFTSRALSQNDSHLEIQEQITTGTNLYKKQKFSEALAHWHKVLENKNFKTSAELYFNLGLTEIQNKDYGLGLAHLRKALSLKPYSIKIRQTLEWAIKTLEEKEYLDIKRDPVSLGFIMLIPKLLIFVLIALCFILPSFSAARKSLKNPTLKVFFKSFFIGTCLSLLPFILLFLKINHEGKVYATFVGEKSEAVYSSYDLQSPELGRLNTGDSVEIIKEKTHENSSWVLISTRDNAFGWMKANNFIVHSGKIDPL